MTISAATPVLNRVPKITVDFWLIKLMAVTLGETTADYLAVNLGLGLTATSLIMTAVLIGALVLQLGQKRYVPWSCWLAVVLISIVGTLVTDNLVDNFGVSLVTTTVVFTLALIATFVIWCGRIVPKARRGLVPADPPWQNLWLACKTARTTCLGAIARIGLHNRCRILSR